MVVTGLGQPKERLQKPMDGRGVKQIAAALHVGLALRSIVESTSLFSTLMVPTRIGCPLA